MPLSAVWLDLAAVAPRLVKPWYRLSPLPLSVQPLVVALRHPYQAVFQRPKWLPYKPHWRVRRPKCRFVWRKAFAGPVAVARLPPLVGPLLPIARLKSVKPAIVLLGPRVVQLVSVLTLDVLWVK